MLFASQALHRVSQCCFNGLKTDSYKRYNQRYNACCCKYPPAHFGMESKISQPFMHRPSGYRDGYYS